MENKIKIGVSACVLGECVRFDGGHKRSRFVHRELVKHVDFEPICPEVEIGMPVPRPTIRLVSKGEEIALVETKDASKDHTQAMKQYAKRRVDGLVDQDLCGYIVCAKSPTCGMERVRVYGKHKAGNKGRGIYTQQLIQQMPWLPIEEDGRLNDPVLRENFISRVYCLHDFYQSMAGKPTPGRVVAFHSRYKLTLMAHHPASYKSLGRLVANIKNYPRDGFYETYRNGLMAAMAHCASRRNNTNVLMHIQGFFKRHLVKGEKAELSQLIGDYRAGLIPLLAPLTLLKHHLSRFPSRYLRGQVFLTPIRRNWVCAMDCEKRMYAIREVSALTGVKPVTLRAWQRRYGIIQPERTDKGHRLYTDQHIERIKSIQNWLEKGVAIGKVKALIENGHRPGDFVQEKGSLKDVELLFQSLSRLDRKKAASIVASVFKEYPLNIAESQFVKPVFRAMNQMKKRERSLQLGLFQSILIDKLSAILEAENKAALKGPCLLVSYDSIGSIALRIWALGVVAQGIHVSLAEGVTDISALIHTHGVEAYSHIGIFSSQSPGSAQIKLARAVADLHGDRFLANHLMMSLMDVS